MIVERQSADLIGAVLEQRYRVDSLIARGGMSAVYRGLDTRLDRPVAIKVMDPRFADDRSFIDRFVREAKAAAKLQHPNVVGVFDQGVDRNAAGADRVFLTMELVDGGTLRDLLAEHRELPVPLALSVLEPVLAALAAAHRQGLVHRDIKPENVLIGADGAVKVADFGLVRAAAESNTTSDSVILGTVAYLSPEQVETGAADERSDVYAAGVVLYEMLTGTPPFTGDTALSVAFRHVNSDIPPPSRAEPTLPAALDDLVVRATRRDPKLRPPSAEAFRAELVRLRSELGIRPVTVPRPRSGRSAPAAGPGVDPPTDRMTPVAAPPGQAGPRGTMALARPERTAPPVPPPAPGDPYAAERRRSRRTVGLWLGIVVALAAALGVAAWWLGSGRWTDVPTVAGQDRPTAEQLLRTAYLTPKVVGKHDNTIPTGKVIGTDPGAGTRELRDTEVQLFVSEGKPVVPPIAAGTAQDAATQAITAADLTPKVDPGKSQYSATVPAGRVISVSPGPGTTLDVGSPVQLVLSKGPQPVQVPDVSGMSKDQAFATLTQAGLKPVDGGTEASETYTNGQVVRTSPAAGSGSTVGSVVQVVTSSTISVPNVTGAQLEQAVQLLQSLGLVADVQRMFPGETSGRVIAQSPFPGTRAQAGQHVHLTVLNLIAW